MPTREELEALSTKELHDRAIDVAKHHTDVAFLWRLVKALPVAEEVTGDDDRAKTDILRPIALINDFLYDSGEGALGEALRPMYVDYLLEKEG
ncbi:MAG: hypothetical protein ACM3OO_09625 [Planctomycetaceae bacterium]